MRSSKVLVAIWAVVVVWLWSLVGMADGAGHQAGLEAANPAWSRDGSQIAFAYLGVPNPELGVMRAVDGRGKRVLLRMDSCCEPVLWAAGNRIAFVANYHLYAVANGGGKPVKLFGDTPWFILSPNGETVALDDGCGCGHAPDSVALVNARGGKPFVVPRPANATDWIDGFSPDGTQLVFTRSPWAADGAPKGRSQLFLERVGGGRPVPLRRSGLIGASSVPLDATEVQWSPDGEWIAFVAPGPRRKLELVRTADGRARTLVSPYLGSSFSWSPASNRIAYGWLGKPGRLATVDLKGNRTVVSGTINWMSDDSLDRPQWSPDGTKLTFMGLVGPNVPGRPPAGVWIVGADGHGLKRIA